MEPQGRYAVPKPDLSTRTLVMALGVVIVGVSASFLVPYAYFAFQEWRDADVVVMRDRWVAETDELVDVVDVWTGRDRVVVWFESCDRRVVMGVGYDEADNPVAFGDLLPDPQLVDEDWAGQLERAACPSP